MVNRRRLVFGGAIVASALLVLAVLVLLPVILRGVLETRLAKMTGRAVSIADIDLNIFTGRVGIARFRLAQKGSNDPAVEFERLEMRVAVNSLLGNNIRIREIILTAPVMHVTRFTIERFDFSDLLDLIPPPDPNAKPSTKTIMIERATLTRGAVLARDESVTPPATWRIDGLEVDGVLITTRPDARPGRLSVSAKVNGTPLSLVADAVEVTKGAVNGRLKLDAFDVALTVPYAPATAPARPTAGRVTIDLGVVTSRTPEGKPKVVLNGEVRLADLIVRQRDAPADFLRLPRLAVTLKDTSPLEGAINLASVELEGLDLTIIRDKQGRIDLLALAGGGGSAPPSKGSPPSATPPAKASAPTAKTSAPSAPPPAAPPAEPATSEQRRPAQVAVEQAAAMVIRVAVERVALAKARATFKDEAVSPTTTLTLSDLSATVTGLVWPGPKPFDVVLAVNLPSAGKFNAKGPVTLEPIVADLATSMRGASIEPYRAYIPIKAQLVGNFNGDNRSKISLAGGKLTVTSKGTSWIDKLELRDPVPGAPTPLKMERMEMAGIDFAWPTYAKVATVTVRKPEAQIDRAADGKIRLRELLVAEPEGGAAPPAPQPVKDAKAEAKDAKTAKTAKEAKPKVDASVPPEAQAKGGAVGFPLDVGAFVIEDGHIRFLDRAVKPPFSETISRLAVRVENLSSTPGTRAKLTSQAIVGGDAALDIHGELAPLGQLYADLTGELRGFTLASVNPYADSAVAWVVEKGKLGIKFHVKIENNQIDLTDEIAVENIHVTPSREDDEVKKRVGLPLGLIVALITDADNSLKINLPVSGELDKFKANFSDAIWTVVKNVVVNIVAAPFRAIGRLFKGKDDKVESLAVEPVTFKPGTDTVADGMDQHLTKVADFMRRAPAIRLTLAAQPGASDVDSLKGQELNARLQARQREKKLKDFPAAVTAEFKEKFPDVKPLPPPDDQLTRLREAEALPPERLSDLLTRRVAAVRDVLTKAEGIPEARLKSDEAAPAPAASPGAAPTPAPPPAPAGDPRVEFRIGQ